MTIGFQNPVVRGHAPDPSVIRVGEDFYLANSSFRFRPGIPILHSRDLVNWATIGFAVSRSAQYRRDGQPGAINLFAPTLRYEEGLFYLVCTNQADGQGNFYVTATDPAGPWSDAIWVDTDAFDPSLFRDDDGTWYYTRRTLEFGTPDGNLGPVVQAEIDIATGALGEIRPITEGRRGFVSNDIEGPHIYKRDSWYYLSAAEGGSWKGHMQTVGRSRSPWGPFEPAPHNPILSHREFVANPIQTVGHAELIEDQHGRWWAFALATRHPMFGSHHTLGRETFLAPVKWKGGWPYVGDNGHVAREYDDLPLPASPVSQEKAGWLGGWRSVTSTEGVTFDGSAVSLRAGDNLDSPAPGAIFLAQTEYDQQFIATAEIVAGAEIGVAVWANSTHHYLAAVRGDKAVFRKHVDDILTESLLHIGSAARVTFRIVARPNSYTFEIDVDGVTHSLGLGEPRMLSAEYIQWFTNVNFTLLATGDASTLVEFTEVQRIDLAPLPPTSFGVPQ